MTDSTTEQMTPAQASEKLATLTADKDWSAKLLSGDGSARKEFDTVTQAKQAGESRFDRVMSGKVEPQSFELVADGDLSTADLSAAVGWLREAGLSEGTIRELHSGAPVSAELKREAEQFGKELLSDREWTKRLLAGGAREQKQLLALNCIRLAPVVE